MTVVLDKGFVTLEQFMGDDLGVVNAARVSLKGRSDWEVNHGDHPELRHLSDKDEGLIGFLMRERHGTPFEHNAFTFHVKCPIFVAREWMRHRIGSFNEMSGRYTKLEPDFYYPESENVRTQVGKPGAYVFNVMKEQEAAEALDKIGWVYEQAWENYEFMLQDGVAKEVARMVLPVGIYTQFFWTVNARSLMNFLNLRMAETAMYEIRMYAYAVRDLWKEKMPVTYRAWVANDMVAP